MRKWLAIEKMRRVKRNVKIRRSGSRRQKRRFGS
jgi:hypothetical protein